MTHFPSEDQRALHGREDVRIILKINDFTKLASGEEDWREKEADMLCVQVEKSQEDAGDFRPITIRYGTICAG